MRFQARPKMDNRFFEGNRKREAPVDDIEDERVFKLRKKMVGIGLGELYDLGVIPIKLKVKKESTEPQPAPSKTAVHKVCLAVRDLESPRTA